MNMQTEPIRLPAWIVSLMVLVIPSLIQMLQGQEWRDVLVTFLGSLLAGGAIVGVAESKRARTDSPATIENRLASYAYQHEDEVDHTDAGV